MDFTNRQILITGAAQGIGFAVAQKAAELGAHPIVLDYDSTALGTAKEILPQASYYQLDLLDHNNSTSFLNELTKNQEPIDILINNAGIISSKPFEEISLAEWECVLAINLTAYFVTSSVLFPQMKQRGYGKIVNVSSVAGKRGGAFLGTAAYAASKAGILGLTKSLAIEGAAYGVYANAVCPASTISSITVGAQEQNPALPLGRMAQPAEIANAILFLASDESSYITGEVVHVDGGLVMCG